ncbi:hypothetical protein LguiA_003566 [Lonicera macranthoides]
MESSKRTMASQANDGFPPKRPKNSVFHPQTSKALNTNSSSQSEASVHSQVDSIGESPSTQHVSGLTEEDAKKLLETLTNISLSLVWAHYERW